MFKLDRVSKYYSENGMVSTGFSKVSLELNMGEFVAITGESGSGKSTLLNVLSGLDTYEEGEMWVNGEQTSGFTKTELEEYRKKYIGSIFQTFNLISSYTVYQNVELVLLLSGYSKKEAEPKVHEIIEKVGLSEYTKTKASKLSGGQKQRVAIARALAKETPIIVADEPTGNLDTKSAAEIIKLLHELSKDKLIIIVTHNFDQVEPYITRKLTMHDGKIIEDKPMNGADPDRVFDESNIVTAKDDDAKGTSITRLGVRNTFNIPAKFILMMVVFVFLCTSIVVSYVSTSNLSSTTEGGYNSYFGNIDKNRIIVIKDDKSKFKKSDYDKLGKLENVENIIKNDISLDISGYLENDVEGEASYWINTGFKEARAYKGRLESGRMPRNSSEAILMVPKDGYAHGQIDTVLKNRGTLTSANTGMNLSNGKIKIVGYGLLNEAEESALIGGSNYLEAYLCFNDIGMKTLRNKAIESYCTQKVEFENHVMTDVVIHATDRVPEGQVYIGENLSSITPNYVIGRTLQIRNKNMYFSDEFDFTVTAVYKKTNCEYLLGVKDIAEIEGEIFINEKDYNKMFAKGNFQISVFAKSDMLVEQLEEEIQELGYDTFAMKNGIYNPGEDFNVFLNLIMLFTFIGSVVVLFFVTYFIVKLILKSRNVYYSTIRMLGGTRKNCNRLIQIEVLTIAHIAFGLCMAGVAAIKAEMVSNKSLIEMFRFIDVKDCVIIYVLIIAMSILLAARYAKQLFKKSAMSTYKEEV